MAPSIVPDVHSKKNDICKDQVADSNAPSKDVLYTTSNGAPFPHPYLAERAGANGPLLLQDFHLIDLISHFDRERIPERVVHAKGSGAHGYFECTDSLEDICVAEIFKRGAKCPVAARFSTVGGERGSHDLARDPRGFAVKFKTSEGNWDMVGNNTPVFFLRDPSKFPHFIHTQKRDPATNLGGGDDSTMFWDYLCNNPESVHQLMILFSHRGIPDGYRHMNGYLGHTMKMINANGDWVYTQIHYITKQGIKNVPRQEAHLRSPDYSQKDLYEAIESGSFPAWEMFVQVMTPQQAVEAWEKHGINVFDLTHIWPHALYPMRKVGHFVLNENAKNYFAEIEQSAFSPSHLIPGIAPTADPVLQSRLYSYPDTHRHRLGTNYQQLPVNAPRTSYWMGNFQRDGAMSFFNQGKRSNYLSSIEPISFKHYRPAQNKEHEEFVARATYWLSEIRPEDFQGPRNLWEKVFDEKERTDMVEAIAEHMANCHKPELIKRQIAIFRQVSEDIASRLERLTGIKGYSSIAELSFNGSNNGMTTEPKYFSANGQPGPFVSANNGPPVAAKLC